MIEFKSYFSGSSGNLHTCSDGDTKIIIDFGVPFKQAQKALNFSINTYSGIIASHAHRDHCKGVPEAVKRGMDCYLLKDIINSLKIDSGVHIKEITPLKIFKIGSLKILPFDLQHDVPIVGFLIQSIHSGKMVYITDSYFCRYFFKEVEIFAIECNYAKEILEENIKSSTTPKEIRNRIVKSHFELENVKEFLRANDLSKVEQIHLIHISDTNGDPKFFKEEIQKLTGKPVYIRG